MVQQSGPSYRGGGRVMKFSVTSAAVSEEDYIPDEEKATPVADVPFASLAPVLLSVMFAAMGGIAFGYHVAILNGPLELVASQLGFGADQSLIGGVRSAFHQQSLVGHALREVKLNNAMASCRVAIMRTMLLPSSGCHPWRRLSAASWLGRQLEPSQEAASLNFSGGGDVLSVSASHVPLKDYRGLKHLKGCSS